MLNITVPVWRWAGSCSEQSCRADRWELPGTAACTGLWSSDWCRLTPRSLLCRCYLPGARTVVYIVCKWEKKARVHDFISHMEHLIDSHKHKHVYLYLLLQSHVSLQADGDHLMSDRKLLRKFGALLDYYRVAAVQELVPKHEVLSPVLHHILWMT